MLLCSLVCSWHLLLGLHLGGFSSQVSPNYIWSEGGEAKELHNLHSCSFLLEPGAPKVYFKSNTTKLFLIQTRSSVCGLALSSILWCYPINLWLPSPSHCGREGWGRHTDAGAPWTYTPGFQGEILSFYIPTGQNSAPLTHLIPQRRSGIWTGRWIADMHSHLSNN